MKRLLTLVFLFSFNATCAEELLPAYLLQLHEATKIVLVAETETSTLFRYSNEPNGFQLRDIHYMSVGESGVGKQRAWDRLTPLGVYFVSDELDTSKLHAKYGITAFPLDYPNTWDRLHGRAGDGIWLHGVDPEGGRRPAQDTDGCLALPNERLLMIIGDIQPLSTPVIITRKIRWLNPEVLRERAASIDAVTRAWANSFAAGDLHAYFRMYADEFRYRGMSRDEWMGWRVETSGGRVLDGVLVDELSVLADPEDTGLYVSRFRQTLVEGDRRVTTMKRLYWRRSESGAFKIVAEDNG